MSLFALMVGIGILLVYILGAFLDWRIVASVPTILMYTILCVALIFIPESPVWLLGHRGVEEGKDALQWLRNGADVEEELEIMKATMEKQSHGLTMTEALKNLSQRSVRTPFLIIISNFIFILWSGPFAVIFYAVDIFKDAGIDSNEHLAAIIVALVRVGAGLCGLFLIQKLPRRVLAMVGMTTMSVSMFGLGAVVYCKSVYGESKALNILPIIFVSLFMSSFAAGMILLIFSLDPYPCC